MFIVAKKAYCLFFVKIQLNKFITRIIDHTTIYVRTIGHFYKSLDLHVCPNLNAPLLSGYCLAANGKFIFADNCLPRWKKKKP